jgi:hypothetical protein
MLRPGNKLNGIDETPTTDARNLFAWTERAEIVLSLVFRAHRPGYTPIQLELTLACSVDANGKRLELCFHGSN